MVQSLYAISAIVFMAGLVAACSARYRMTGHTNRWPDKTKVYLQDILTNQTIDSAIVDHDKFTFSGEALNEPVNVWIHTADYSEARSLWVEPGRMRIDASRTSLHEADVSGSRTEDEAEILYAMLRGADTPEAEIDTAFAFIRRFPDSRVSAAILAGYAPNADKDSVRHLFDLLSPTNRQSTYGARITRYLDLYRAHQPGDSYTDIVMPDPNGVQQSLSGMMGEATLIEFWASWCGPCRQANPGLVKIYNQYRKRGFRIYAVSLDFHAENWLRAVATDSLAWTHVSELRGRDSRGAWTYGINAIPDNVLIDRHGRIAGRGLEHEALIHALDSLLAVEPTRQ